MIARDALVAGVLAATDKVVQQATIGDWRAALKSSDDRRLLLEQLAQQESQPGEHDFLQALRAAAKESDAALAAMTATSAPRVSPVSQSNHQASSHQGMSHQASSNPAVGTRLCTKA